MADEKEVKFTNSQFSNLSSSLKQQSALLKGILDHLKKQQLKTDKYQKNVEAGFKKQEQWQKGPGLGRFPGHAGNSPYDFISKDPKKGGIEAKIEAKVGKILKRQQDYIAMTDLKHANRFAVLEAINPALSSLVRTFYRLSDTISAVSTTLGALARMGGILFLVLKPVISAYRDTIKGVFEAGYGGKTALAGKLGSAQVNKTLQLSTELFHETGIIESPEEMTKARTSTATALQGNILKIPDSLVKDVAFLNKAFMISMESASKLEADFYRVSGYSKTIAHQSTLFAAALGSLNGMNVQSLFEELASNSEELAKNIGNTKNGFIAGIALAQKLGISVESISKLMDTFSTDFQGTMEMQAKIQTLAPGVDLSKAIYASNFGSQQQTIKALQEAVGPLSGFKDMSRGMKKMLADSFGFSVSDLSKIIAGKDVNIDIPSMEEIAKSQLDSQTQSARLLGGTDGILETLKNIYQLLATSAFFGTPATQEKLSASVIKKGTTPAALEHLRQGMINNPNEFEKLNKDLKTSRMHEITTEAFEGLSGQKQLNDIIKLPTVKKLESNPKFGNDGTSYSDIIRGEWDVLKSMLGFKPKNISMQTITPSSSLNSNNLNEKNSLNAANSPTIALLGNESSRSSQEQPGMAQEITFNTNRLENKVDDLIRLMRNGGIVAQVNLDGKKVSEGLISANNRG